MRFPVTQQRMLIFIGGIAFFSMACFRLSQQGVPEAKMLGTFGLVITFFFSARYLDLLQAETSEAELLKQLNSARGVFLLPALQVQPVLPELSKSDYLLFAKGRCFLLKVEGVRNNLRRTAAKKRILAAQLQCQAATDKLKALLAERGYNGELCPVILLSRRHADGNYDQAVRVTNSKDFLDGLKLQPVLSSKEREGLKKLLLA